MKLMYTTHMMCFNSKQTEKCTRTVIFCCFEAFKFVSSYLCSYTDTFFFPFIPHWAVLYIKKNSSLTMKDNSPKWIKDNKAFMAANEPHDIFPKRASGYRVMLHEQEILHIEKKALGMTSLLIKWKEGATSERGERVQISVWSGLLHPQPLLSNILT